MNRLASILSLFVVTTVAACGGGSGMTGDDMPGPDGGTVHLDPAKCTGFAQSFATAAQTCGQPLPAGAQAAFEGWCKKGVTAAAMCGGNPATGLDCFATPDANDWVCQLGQPYPACNGDLAAALGSLCVVALGNPSCASGIHCELDTDCSNGLACNGATGQCFSKSAYCIGMPCELNTDCPQGETCNGAEHACVGQ